MSNEVSQAIRARIGEKLRLGTLPRERPRVLKPSHADDKGADWWIGSGPAGQCAACDEQIKDGEMFEGFRYASGVIRVHNDCRRCWEEELHRVAR